MTMTRLTVVKPVSLAEKTTRTTVDTVLITRDLVASWQSPAFQRPLRMNEKVRALAEEIGRNGGVIPGILTIGVLGQVKYRLDGQHRMEAFLVSGAKEGYADVRFFFCENIAQMGEEFVKLNRPLVPLRPDDILRGLEGSYSTLRSIREKCQFVGYDMIRRGPHAPILSMSLALRTWQIATPEVPSGGSTGSAATLAVTLTVEEAEQLIAFLSLCFDAWRRDAEYARLWSSLNLVLCAWLYKRTVITQWTGKTPKLTKDLFRKCLMSLSANSLYLDYLVGRNLSERDRRPAYDRVKRIFADRLTEEMGKRPKMPAPAWSKG